MRIKCDYCGYYIDDSDKFCGVCGAPNDHLVRSADGVPKTVEELKSFCAARNLPLEKMRFFIGIDYKEPRAFGIYKDENGNFVVYKNKADGTRAIRYRGTDEAYAVNEIYQKMKSEVAIRKKKAQGASVPQGSVRVRKSSLDPKLIFLAAFVLFIGLGVLISLIAARGPDRGYYRYDNDYYYYQQGSWYYYDDDDGEWGRAYSVDGDLEENYENYFESENYSADYEADNFEYTEYYSVTEEDDWENDDWDDDDWDYGGDWDAGDTDWNTDW